MRKRIGVLIHTNRGTIIVQCEGAIEGLAEEKGEIRNG